jgi:hypothetical protein
MGSELPSVSIKGRYRSAKQFLHIAGGGPGGNRDRRTVPRIVVSDCQVCVSCLVFGDLLFSISEHEWRKVCGRSTDKTRHTVQAIGGTILGRCPLSAHESESMLRTYLVFKEERERERERERDTHTSKRHVAEAHSVLTAAILLTQRLSYY